MTNMSNKTDSNEKMPRKLSREEKIERLFNEYNETTDNYLAEEVIKDWPVDKLKEETTKEIEQFISMTQSNCIPKKKSYMDDEFFTKMEGLITSSEQTDGVAAIMKITLSMIVHRAAMNNPKEITKLLSRYIRKCFRY